MLLNLEIKNIALIDSVSTDIASGMTVLTGETGAGKSIIIDSVNLLMGARASREMIRYGEEKARVQGLFFVSDRIKKEIAELGLDADDNMVSLLRDISVDGKSVCRINGMIVTSGVLKEVSALLLNIHGQQDNHSLLNPKNHLKYIDGFAGNERERINFTKAYTELLKLKKHLSELENNQKELEERRDLLSYQTEEIFEAALRVGEADELSAERELLVNAEKINSAVMESLDLLYDGEVSAYDLVSSADKAMSRLSGLSVSEGINEKILDIKYAIEDLSSEIRDVSEGAFFSPERLNEIEERLDLIFKLQKKYGGSEEAVLEYMKKAEEELFSIDTSDVAKEKLKSEIMRKEIEVKELSEKLTLTRKKAGEKLSALIAENLKDLDMPKVKFEVLIEDTEYTSLGKDWAEFMICPNIGEELKPLAKFASGGELSRVMLAMKSVLADLDGVETLIFDEIDTGVSGSAAQKIAKKLKSLSKGRQVLCVSHHAQPAAIADSHFKIVKKEENGRTVTSLNFLLKEDRIMEIARLTDGENPSREAIEHAKVMIENA
ncbi:MAG: DNA repair protein RecN [Clostridia bacterium]|nr:DNA repair protein RecN [Clostridia bacterium]